MLLVSNGFIHTIDPSLPSPEAVLIGDDGRDYIGALFGPNQAITAADELLGQAIDQTAVAGQMAYERP